MTDNLKIDLHTHSTASDGTFSPHGLAKLAKTTGLCAIALTDHDTIDGLEEFHKACGELGIEGISGVEISAQYHKEMHIVGLFVDEKDEVLKEKLDKLKKARETRNRKMLELLRENGIDITENDIISQKEGATLLDTGRAHIARAMVNKGYVKTVDEAFSGYLKKGKSCYVKRTTYPPKESIAMINAAGGSAVLAHPIYITDDYDELFETVKKLKEYGLAGMECYYSSYTEEYSRMCEEICDKLEIVKSGGSDFHGLNKPDIELGRVSTGHVPYSVLRIIKEQRGEGL